MDELQSSLTTYELQLEQVQKALAVDGDNEDLKKLHEDLQQLITLTTESLLASHWYIVHSACNFKAISKF